MDHKGIGANFRTRFLTGLFITFPLVLTILVVEWLFQLLDKPLGQLITKLLGRHLPGLGLVLSLLIIFGIGVGATTVFGRKFLAWLERVMLSLPVFKSFYSTFKQLGDAFSPENRSAFKQFVIVEYPRIGAHSFGFLTKECTIKDNNGRDECFVTVYIPTNHLYLGDMALFRKDEIIVTDLTIEEGIKIVLSAGIAAPNAIGNSRDYSLMAGSAAPLKTGVSLAGTDSGEAA